MIVITEKKQCCGCTACESVCGQNAIRMSPDELGFLYPVVDREKCIDCGMCDKTCQFKEDYCRYNNYNTPIAYSMRLIDNEQLMRSQSGGAFYWLAEPFLREGGVVYGAAFDQGWHVIHKRAADINSLESLRMTKYVQSDLRGVLTQVKEDLKYGLKVLFSGTACQIAGLKSYIPRRLHDNLYCVDIICHGVPSPKIWQDYVTYLQHEYNTTIVKVCFRDKRFGWHGARESFRFANDKEVIRGTNNFLYFSGMTLRESCACCKFTNTKRIGDITIGDLWGLPKEHHYEIDGKGVSLMLVNSAKGSNWLKKLSNDCNIQEIVLADYLQPQLREPSKLNTQRAKFVEDYCKYGFLYVAKRYGDMGWIYKLESMLTRIKKIIR